MWSLTKKIFFFLLLTVVLLFPASSYAATKEEHDEAYTLYAAAGGCLAAYSDRIGKLAYEYFEDDGWEIQPFASSTVQADARFIFLKKTFVEDGQVFYMLAIVGTETVKDVKVDLRVDKVYFEGKTPEEFTQNAQLKNIPDTLPKVHRGFHQYVEAAVAAKTVDSDGNSKSLAELLLAYPNRKVYLVGHSLGGAVAIIAGARLINTGVNPNQIEVITFGSPAVGNEAFARQYEKVLPLTRVVISGDMVTGVLQKLVGGYKQFGREIRWQLPNIIDSGPHGMSQYLDLAMKNYYRVMQRAVETGVIEPPVYDKQAEGIGKVYIAPVKNTLPKQLQEEFWYMQQGLWLEYQDMLPAYFIDRSAYRDVSFREAAEKGYRWMIVPEINGYRLKEKENRYYITLQQMVYDTKDGRLVKAKTFSSGTYHLTPLECLIHNANQMSKEEKQEPFWLLKESGELRNAYTGTLPTF